MLARNEKYQQVLDCCMKLKVHLIRFRLHHLVEAHMCDVFVMAQWLAKLPSDYYSLLIVNEKWGVNVPWSWWGWSISYHYISTKLLPGCIVMIYWFHGPRIH
jgi:hypothetical protein